MVVFWGFVGLVVLLVVVHDLLCAVWVQINAIRPTASMQTEFQVLYVDREGNTVYQIGSYKLSHCRFYHPTLFLQPSIASMATQLLLYTPMYMSDF